jgi:hypothetical protein
MGLNPKNPTRSVKKNTIDPFSEAAIQAAADKTAIGQTTKGT